MTTPIVKTATADDEPALLDVLTLAFVADPFLRWLWPDARYYLINCDEARAWLIPDSPRKGEENRRPSRECLGPPPRPGRRPLWAGFRTKAAAPTRMSVRRKSESNRKTAGKWAGLVNHVAA
jgi:hypothetical protein